MADILIDEETYDYDTGLWTATVTIDASDGTRRYTDRFALPPETTKEDIINLIKVGWATVKDVKNYKLSNAEKAETFVAEPEVVNTPIVIDTPVDTEVTGNPV